ncbi:MAG: hypothetical protein CMI52_02465 [Parcubacteria group bacterium]|nr:hypothetical protein [Parcubacteria group bacterium]|tara:strand:- start:1731 stop:2153 length:423 start_codon:yes stop_codon:yes gene_type:complete
MDQRRLNLFNEALSEMTNGICGPAAHWQTVTHDLGLVESQAKDVICRFLTYHEDFMFLANSGLIEPPPEQSNGDPHVYSDQIAEIPVSARGVMMLQSAINAGLFIELFITDETFVMDVINFVKGIELMDVAPELIQQYAA